MEQLCFLKDFPDSEEEKLYESFGKDGSGNYEVLFGGTYVFVKHAKGLTIRFTSPDIKDKTMNAEKIEAWIGQLHQKHPGF